MVNNFTVHIVLSPIQFTHNCSPAKYTTTLILKVIDLAHFLLIFIMKNG